MKQLLAAAKIMQDRDIMPLRSADGRTPNPSEHKKGSSQMASTCKCKYKGSLFRFPEFAKWKMR
jgi:hypothetical protein